MREFLASIYAAMERYLYWVTIPKITKIDVVEIIIIAVLLYYLLLWVKNTRAWNLLKGILVILVFLIIAAIFQMTTILWLASKLFSIAAIAVIVIFQPELRRALEQLGQTNLLSKIFDFQKKDENAFDEKTAGEIIKACYDMGRVKTGALIVVERSTSLNEYIRTGITVDAVLTNQLLINIFEKNTPLHDGAVIVRGKRVVSATCYLPLSDNMKISKELGTRHRAAVGVSENSDAVTIVVSEETGAVSLAFEGRLYRDVSEEFLRERLITLMGAERERITLREKLKRRLKNASEDRKVDHK